MEDSSSDSDIGRLYGKAFHPPFPSLKLAFRHCALAYADRPAIITESGPITYRELDARSNALASGLLDLGLGDAESVGVMLADKTQYLISIVALVKLGVAYVPVDPALPQDRINALIAAGGCEAILCSQGAPGEFPAIRVDWESMPAPGSAPVLFPNKEPEPDSPLYIMFTSGTTGLPKGVIVRHSGVLRLVLDCDWIEIRSEDRFLVHSPLGFDASTFEIWAALLNGAALVPYPKAGFDNLAIAALLSRERVTIAWFTAAVFHALAGGYPKIFSGLRYVLAGGDIVEGMAVKNALEANPELVFLNGYGPTENTTFTTVFRAHRGMDFGLPLPIGSPICGTDIYVLDPGGLPVAEGGIGEIHVAGAGLALGYRKDPARTKEKFIRAEIGGRSLTLYRTGDQGSIREGLLHFHGRKDGQVKLRGYRIELAEVEHHLLSIHGVREAAAIVMEIRTAVGPDKLLIAFTVLEPGVTHSPLQGEMSAKLPRYLVPDRFIRVDSLPLTPNGKLDRKSLALLAEAAERPPEAAVHADVGAAAASPGGAPTGAAAETIARTVMEAWEECLGRPIASSGEGPESQGATSLTRIMAHWKICRKLEIAVPAGEFKDADSFDRWIRIFETHSHRSKEPIHG